MRLVLGASALLVATLVGRLGWGPAFAEPLRTDRYEILTANTDPSGWERGPVDASVLVELYYAPGHAGAANAAEIMRRSMPRSDGRRDGVALRQKVHLVPLRAPLDPDPVSETLVEADAQGRFWDLFDRITQERVPPTQLADLQRLANDAGLDVSRWSDALGDHRHAARVRELWRIALDDGHAPAEAFANGRRLSTWMNVDAFDTAVQAAARRAERLAEEGGTLAEAVEKLRAREREQQLAVDRNRLPRRVMVAGVGLDLGDARRGPGFAPIRIDFYGTLGNSTAAEWAQALRRLESAYPGSIQIAFHSVVVLRGSSDERLLALAVVAARQDRFWPLYDAVFANPLRAPRRTPSEVEAVARRLGIDTDLANDMVYSHEAEQLGDERRGHLSRLGVGSVPVVLLNGLILPAGLPFERLRRFVDSELAQGVLESTRGPAPRSAPIRIELLRGQPINGLP